MTQSSPSARRLTIAAQVGLLALLSAPAWGQNAVKSGDLLIPVEQGVEDISPVAEGLRYVDPRSTQQPSFDQLWRLRGTDYFVRVDGALHAVFRRSDYQTTARGVHVAVPADTVFYIGVPTDLLPPGDPGQGRAWPEQPPHSPRWSDSRLTLGPIAKRVDTRIDRYLSPTATTVQQSGPRAQETDAKAVRTTPERVLRPPAEPVDPKVERERTLRVCSLIRQALSEPTATAE